MIYNVFSVIVLAMLICLSLYILLNVAINLIRGKRENVILYLRNFKKGGYIYIYLASIPLFFMGYKYGGEGILISFFFSVKEILNLVVLKYETKAITALMQANKLFKIAVYYDFVLVFINATLFVISIIDQYIWDSLSNFLFKFGFKNRTVLFGFNKENLQICQSDNSTRKLVVAKLKDKESQLLYLKKVPYKSVNSYLEEVANLLELAKKSKKDVVWIINTGSDDENIKIARELISHLEKCPDNFKQNLYLHFKAYLFGNPIFLDIFEDIEKNSYGCIIYTNKYQKIAIDFIDRYPFTKFMDENQIDYSTTLLKQNVDINVMLIGFGNTNQQIFLTSVANNQFLTQGQNDNIILKKVNYYVFDKEKDKSDKNLNHNYFRYEMEVGDLQQKDYLDFPSAPAKVEFLELNVNNKLYYSKLKEICTQNKNSKNFIIIAFGQDLENIDMAQKLSEKKEEWGLNCEIFAKSNDYVFSRNIQENACQSKTNPIKSTKDYILFGNNKEIVYNLDNIISGKIYKMAKLRNILYDLEYAVSNNGGKMLSQQEVLNISKTATETWHKNKLLLDRESSLFACLSIKSKLNLMGLDYVSINQTTSGISQQEYFKIYDDKNQIKFSNVSVDGKNLIDYNLDFSYTKRGILAIHEHYRWNSFMISKGYIPATVNQILQETTIKNGKEKYTNGKNVKLKTHGNITTIDGLIEFRQKIAKRDNQSELSKDVIKYDYQLLDDVYWLLQKCGYKIVKK